MRGSSKVIVKEFDLASVEGNDGTEAFAASLPYHINSLELLRDQASTHCARTHTVLFKALADGHHVSSGFNADSDTGKSNEGRFIDICEFVAGRHGFKCGASFYKNRIGEARIVDTLRL